MKIAIIGAGWSGYAAAVEATRLGHQVTVFEASRTAGGRARRVMATVAGQPAVLDNGQHILIGAYVETLRLMKDVGVDPDLALLRLPLALRFPDGAGLALPRWPAPLDAVAGILAARGWSWADKLSLLRVALGWRLAGFACGPFESVKDLCRGLTPGAMASLIDPLCVSALNTPAERASGQVFLRVMRDALFAQSGGSNLLLPRVDLSALLPDAALAWLAAHGGRARLGVRVQAIAPAASGWSVDGEAFGAVLLACPSMEAARLVESSGIAAGAWATEARALPHEALTTVYLYAPQARLREPMLALRSNADEPAQFVFDRARLGGPAGLLAFVVSASVGDGETLTRQVLAQAARQLGLDGLQPVRTIVEKRATFACAPGLRRPAGRIAAGLFACGDYIAGPYPATLEGAVRSGLEAARELQGFSI